MTAYPLLFSGFIKPQFPDDHRQSVTYDPAQWLGEVALQAEAALACWDDEWPPSANSHCQNARNSAQEALQALAGGDVSNAMLSAFQCGRFIEKAQRDFPVEDWLKHKQKRSNEAKNAGSKGGKAKRKAQKGNQGAVEYIYRHLSPAEREGGLTLAQWCNKFLANTKTTCSKKTMTKYLNELGYAYKGKRK